MGVKREFRGAHNRMKTKENRIFGKGKGRKPSSLARLHSHGALAARIAFAGPSLAARTTVAG